MKWGIIGALDVEIQLIKEKMTVTETKEFFGQTYYVGTYQDQEAVLVQCGVGKINAAVCAYTLISEFQVDCIVNVGIAGALAAHLKVMDVVIGDELLFHDIDHDLYKKYHPFETVFSSDEKLVALCQQVIQGLDPEITHYTGRIVTGDEFVESTQMKYDILAAHNPLCVEMEGAAIAMVCYMSKTPFLVIRAMSDSADDNAQETYDNLFDDAAQISANIILKMMETY